MDDAGQIRSEGDQGATLMGFDLSPIAQLYGISFEELDRKIKSHGWDFSSLQSDDEAGREYATQCVTDYAKEMAESKAKRQEAGRLLESQRLEARTAQAKAKPDSVCPKCDGKGELRCFSHVDDGVCYCCRGIGIIRPKRGKQLASRVT